MKPARAGAVAVLALASLGACTDDERKTTSPDGTSTTGPGYTLLLDDDSDPDQVHGRAGAYAMTARGAITAPLAVVDVPDDYENFGFFALLPKDSLDSGDPFRSVQYWTIHGVPRDPCRYSAPAPEIDDSVDDVVEALRAQVDANISEPRTVSLGGQEGVYLEVTAPSDVAALDCRTGYFVLWEGRHGDSQHTMEDGATERIWILDVDGTRVALSAITQPGVTDAESAEVVDIVESVTFADAED